MDIFQAGSFDNAHHAKKFMKNIYVYMSYKMFKYKIIVTQRDLLLKSIALKNRHLLYK